MNLAAAVFAAAAVICISVTVTVLFRPLYYFDMGYLNISEYSGISEEVIKANYDALIYYNLLGGPSELVFSTMSMSREGEIHFEEVKDIFISMQIISIIALILLTAWIVVYAKRKSAAFQWLKLTGAVVAIVVAAVGAAVLIDWNWAFTTMHKIFFRNDFWIFDAKTDPVINILPEQFFMHCGIMIIVLAIVQIIALQLIYRRLKRRRNEF